MTTRLKFGLAKTSLTDLAAVPTNREALRGERDKNVKVWLGKNITGRSVCCIHYERDPDRRNVVEHVQRE